MPRLTKTLQSLFAKPLLELAPALLGMELHSYVEGFHTSGIITEVEAYCGKTDPACHCYNKRTPRTEVMYWEAGYVYVYFIYGMYHCINFVSEARDYGAAILVRAVKPVEGVETMQKRRGQVKESQLTNGPGKLCQAFGIDLSHSEGHLGDKNYPVKLTKGRAISTEDIISGPRIGISKATDLPWRFWVDL